MAETILGTSARDDDDLEKHVVYVHNNPLKHGYVTRAIDWPHSSIHREVARGNINGNWGYLTEPENEVLDEEPSRK